LTEAASAARAPAIILVEPQMGENIGAAARAMANFGLNELRVVAPRDGWPNERAFAMASGADWVLEGARVFPDFDAAVSDLHLLFATTGTPREMVKEVIGPRAMIARAASAAQRGQGAGLVFGPERTGLFNEIVERCDVIVSYPTDARFPSLNLAQSIAIACYEWGVRANPEQPEGWTAAGLEPPASRDQFERLCAHLFEELEAAAFFWPLEKAPAVKRTLRNGLQRGALTDAEIRSMRGAIKALADGPKRRAREAPFKAAEAAARQALARSAPGEEIIRLVVTVDGAAALVRGAQGERTVWIDLPAPA
jgi:tRNA/rRNA methyltransferase